VRHRTSGSTISESDYDVTTSIAVRLRDFLGNYFRQRQ
jgi:hypothetical protein